MNNENELRSKIVSLERDIEVLRTQNSALRRDQSIFGTSENNKIEEMKQTESEMNTINDAGTKDELRQQLHNKWESEKRLQKR